MLIFHILKHNMLCQQVILLLNMEKVITVRAQIRYCITVISYCETCYRQFLFVNVMHWEGMTKKHGNALLYHW